MADQHLRPDLRAGEPCPPDWRNVILAERFGCLPWELEEADFERAWHYIRLLGVEGRMSKLLADLPNDEPLILES